MIGQFYTASETPRGAGPQITQDVLYNNGGTITAATIYAVRATSATGVGYDPNLGAGKWAYPPFQ